MDNTTFCFFICGLASVCTFAIFGIYCLLLAPNPDHQKNGIPRLVLLTSGTYIAVLLIFVPIYYCNYDFGNGVAIIRPLLMSIHNAMRVFILDGEFDIIRDALTECNLSPSLEVFYSAYCTFLYVLAPIMTFGAVLSFLDNFKAKLRYKFTFNRPIYIFSALNDQAIVLARSIFHPHFHEHRRTRPVIVFTEVCSQGEDNHYELLMEAHKVHGICLKDPLTQLDIYTKKGKIEIFLIHEDEAENVSQAAKLTTNLENHGKKQNVKIFVFASSAASAYTMDSLRYDNLLEAAAQADFDDNCFKLRRINHLKQLAWNTVPSMILDHLKNCKHHTISVMIAGTGRHGTEFFKTLMWFCQIKGYHLEVNLFDNGVCNTNRGYIQSVLRRQCPEFVEKCHLNMIGDSFQDIRFYNGVDFETDDFRILLQKNTAERERLKKTDIIIVALGDDDKNIETAVYLRTVFDQAKKVVASEKAWPSIELDSPAIYSIVYDSKKSAMVQENDPEYLINCKSIPYHIHFIGSIATQYQYECIYQPDVEKAAFQYHACWVDEELNNKDLTAEERAHMEKQKILEKKKYERFEFFRHSSMARAVHANLMKKAGILSDKEETVLFEHNRWNAYMRSLGYIYSGSPSKSTRADRAMMHNDLCPLAVLDPSEKSKNTIQIHTKK